MFINIKCKLIKIIAKDELKTIVASGVSQSKTKNFLIDFIGGKDLDKILDKIWRDDFCMTLRGD